MKKPAHTHHTGPHCFPAHSSPFPPAVNESAHYTMSSATRDVVRLLVFAHRVELKRQVIVVLICISLSAVNEALGILLQLLLQSDFLPPNSFPSLESPEMRLFI